jgi:hypothetical protein
MAYEPIDTSSYCVYKSGPFQTYGQNLFAALAAESLDSIQQFIQLLRARAMTDNIDDSFNKRTDNLSYV